MFNLFGPAIVVAVQSDTFKKLVEKCNKDWKKIHLLIQVWPESVGTVQRGISDRLSESLLFIVEYNRKKSIMRKNKKKFICGTRYDVSWTFFLCIPSSTLSTIIGPLMVVQAGHANDGCCHADVDSRDASHCAALTSASLLSLNPFCSSYLY